MVQNKTEESDLTTPHPVGILARLNGQNSASTVEPFRLSEPVARERDRPQWVLAGKNTQRNTFTPPSSGAGSSNRVYESAEEPPSMGFSQDPKC